MLNLSKKRQTDTSDAKVVIAKLSPNFNFSWGRDGSISAYLGTHQPTKKSMKYQLQSKVYLSVKDKVFLYDNKKFFEPYPSLKTARLRLKNVQMFPKMGKIKSWFWKKKNRGNP